MQMVEANVVPLIKKKTEGHIFLRRWIQPVETDKPVWNILGDQVPSRMFS